MTIEEQRKLGVKLATQHNAPRTLEVIKDTDSFYGDIIKTAAEELGVDKLVPIILAQNNPIWAQSVLSYVSDLCDFREPLDKQAAPLQEGLILADSEDLVSLGNITAFELDVVVGASFAASFTMYWEIGTNVTEPKAGYPKTTPPYKWSRRIPIGQTTTNICRYFELPKAKLEAGNIVWMIVDVCGGGWYDTKFRFTYDPNGDTAVISADGGTVTASFTYKIKV